MGVSVKNTLVETLLQLNSQWAKMSDQTRLKSDSKALHSATETCDEPYGRE